MGTLISGSIQRVANSFDSVRSGTRNITDAPVALAARQTTIMQVIVQNSAASASMVYIGNRNRQHLELAAGDRVNIPVTDLAQVYVRAAAGGTATVNWLMLV